MLTLEQCEILMSSTHQVFEQVKDISDEDISKLREGDLILKNMSTGCSPLYHAGIYCGNEEVIEFTAPSDTKWYEKIPMLLLPQRSAAVIKESVSHFLNGKLHIVFRLQSGIPAEFSTSVKSLMKYNEEYNLSTNNCLHFALRLLKLQPGPLPERKSPSDSKNTRASETQIQSTKPPSDENQLLMSDNHQQFKGDESDVSWLNEGDLILRNMNTPSCRAVDNAGSCSGNNVVITLTDDVKRPPMKNEGQSLLKTV